MKIQYNKPLVLGNEIEYIGQVISNDQFSGNGSLTKSCNKVIEDKTGTLRSIMTSSCTDALEMAALLCDLEPDDEVIMPSFTFVSTASAFALRRVKIVWCDIRPDTKNIDENKIESLITGKTKALVVVHYAGIACEMDRIQEICRKHKILLIEDAAQAIDCYYKGRHLGSIGDFGTLSFHETKNIQCGEGGALLVNNKDLSDRAEFIRDKGTNRIHFNKGIVDKYTWVELGSSFLMSELQAAFLYPQLLRSKEVNNNRLESWKFYYKLLSDFIPAERLPYVPDNCRFNGHIFYLTANSREERSELISYLAKNEINAIFHYVPLHKAPYWKGSYDNLDLQVTDRVSSTLVRLPLYYGIKKEEIQYVTDHIREFYKGVR
jgi:dTDP-4-amino-4,6-dideoxygalactose transaminase